jgi:hypothetical protein
VKTPKPKTPKEPKEPAKKRAAEDDPEDNTPAKKAKGTKANEKKSISTKLEDLSEEDKMLLEWRNAGKDWKTINAEWARITGKAPGGSTLPNRIGRVRAALANVSDEHSNQLMESEKAIMVEIAVE